MAAYNFKNEAKVYVVFEGDRYNIDISEITFTQTFMEESYSSKTIGLQNFFEASIINKANPANFSLTFPALQEDDFKILFDRALDYDTFDLFISTEQDTFKIEYCVITNATFLIEKTRPLSISISGQGSKLSQVGSLEGTSVSRAASMTYTRVDYISILLSSTYTLDTDLHAVVIELNNNIKWVPNTTLTACIESSSVFYPENFVVESRYLGGTVTRYLTDVNDANLQTWNINTPLSILAGTNNSGFKGFNFNLGSVMFANQLTTGDVFTQVYNWQLVQNPTDLSDIVSYATV